MRLPLQRDTQLSVDMVAVIRRCGGAEISGVKRGRGNGDGNGRQAEQLGLPVPSTSTPMPIGTALTPEISICKAPARQHHGHGYIISYPGSTNSQQH